MYRRMLKPVSQIYLRAIKKTNDYCNQSHHVSRRAPLNRWKNIIGISGFRSRDLQACARAAETKPTELSVHLVKNAGVATVVR
jgi:hypothetical protein